jgi:ATPase family associated with various cellular activities (AAA)
MGIHPRKLEFRLKAILKLVRDWNAILLLDEADVLLQKRSDDDLQRNAMVSIFLQRLEYSRGVIFLTTNRETEIDTAFRSRIHITLKYATLTYEAKKELWKLFIGKLKKLQGIQVHEPNEQEYKDLARKEFNGREVCLINHSGCYLPMFGQILPLPAFCLASCVSPASGSVSWVSLSFERPSSKIIGFSAGR